MEQTSFHVACGEGPCNSSPGVGAPAVPELRPQSRGSGHRVPSRRKEPGRAALRGTWEGREGARLALPTCFGTSVGGGESRGYPAGEPPYSSSAWLV